MAKIDFSKQGSISNYNPSIRDSTAYWLAKMWFGDDRKGVEKAKRFIDVGSMAVPPAGMVMGVDQVVRDLQQDRPLKETAIDLLLSGIVPIPGAKALGPGLKKAAKAIEPQSPAIKNTLQVLDEALLKLKGPTKNLAGIEVPIGQIYSHSGPPTDAEIANFVKKNKDFYTPSELAKAVNAMKGVEPAEPLIAPKGNYFAPLKTEQTKQKTYGELIDEYKTKSAVVKKQEEVDALASLKKILGTDKPTSIATIEQKINDIKAKAKTTPNEPEHWTDWQLNTDATFEQLDEYFKGNIPEYADLTPEQLDVLDKYLAQNKPGKMPNPGEPGYDDAYLEDADLESEPSMPAISHGSNQGIDASHISSAKFDDFRMDKVLTGEGTIMEGYGPYTTNEPHVLPYYKRQFTTANTKLFPYDAPRQKAAEAVANYIGESYTAGNADAANLKAATSKAINGMKYFEGTNAWRKQDDETLKILRDWNKNGIPEGAVSTPYQYDVNLDVDPNSLPEYRKPLNAQYSRTQNRIRSAYMEHPGVSPTDNTEIKTYEDIYNEIFRAEMAKRGLKNPSHVGSVRPDKYGTDSEDVTIAKKLIEDHGSIIGAAKWVDDNVGNTITTAEADALNAALVQIEDSSIPNTPAGVQAKQIVEHFKNDTAEALKFIHGKGYNKYDPNTADDILKIITGWFHQGVDFGPKQLGTPRDAAAATSAYLNSKGIPGHKYLPGEGVYGDQGTRNFVSYNNHIKIIKRIKLALAAGVPTAILASQYGQDNVDAAEADAAKPNAGPPPEEQHSNWPAKSSNLYDYPSEAFFGSEGPWARLYPREKPKKKN